MPGPARAGALIYASNLQNLSAFYQQVLSMRLLFADAEHEVIESADLQLVLHAIPAAYRPQASGDQAFDLREQQAIKLFFTITSLAMTETVIAELGGRMLGGEYTGPGFRVRNACDPEGNVFQVRETTAAINLA